MLESEGEPDFILPLAGLLLVEIGDTAADVAWLRRSLERGRLSLSASCGHASGATGGEALMPSSESFCSLLVEAAGLLLRLGVEVLAATKLNFTG